MNGVLVELDGAKKFPISHGPTSDDTFISDAAKVIQHEFIRRLPESALFSLLTVGAPPPDEW